MFRSAVAKVTWVLEWIAIACFIATVLLVVISVALRPLQIATPWSDEGACLLFIWTTFLAAAVALKRGKHIRIDFLILKMPEKAKNTFLWLLDILCLPFCVGLIYGNYLMMEASIHMRSPALEISLVYYYLPLFIGFIMMAVYLMISIFEFILGKAEKGEGR
jgi:TRAP-type C4-dicarboxylate transport system permease small subunit